MSFALYIIIDTIFKLEIVILLEIIILGICELFLRVFFTLLRKTINYEGVDERNLNNIEAH